MRGWRLTTPTPRPRSQLLSRTSCSKRRPYCSRWRSPRNSSITRAAGVLRERAAYSRSRSSDSTAAPNAAGRRIVDQQAVGAVLDLVDDAADGAGDDRPFASTSPPRPSARSPRRGSSGRRPWRGAGARSRSPRSRRGRPSGCRRGERGCGRRAAAPATGRCTRRAPRPPPGSSATPVTTGTAEQQVRAERRVDVLGEAVHHARHVLHPVPARDLDDERRVGGGGGPVWITSTWRLIRPGEPSRRVNGTTGGVSVAPSSSPT